MGNWTSFVRCSNCFDPDRNNKESTTKRLENFLTGENLQGGNSLERESAVFLPRHLVPDSKPSSGAISSTAPCFFFPNVRPLSLSYFCLGQRKVDPWLSLALSSEVSFRFEKKMPLDHTSSITNFYRLRLRSNPKSGEWLQFLVLRSTDVMREVKWPSWVNKWHALLCSN